MPPPASSEVRGIKRPRIREPAGSGATKRACERQSEKPVRDGAAKRRLSLSPRRIDVNPLTVFGGVGKSIDPCLRHLHPIADGQLLAEALAERTDVDNVDHLVA